MRVTVTGAHGFLGQYTTRALAEAGHEVQALGHYGHGEYSDNDGDILSPPWIGRKFGEFGPDVVVHLASLVDVPRSFKDPAWYRDVIFTGTLNVLNACLAYRAKLVYVSSSEVYGQVPPGTSISDRHPAYPNSPYAREKLYAENKAAYHGAVIIRPFNAFGAGQSQRAVLPSLARQALDTGGAGYVIGNNSTRTWTHAADLARAFVLAASMELLPGRPYNIGAPWKHSVVEAAEIMSSILGHAGKPKFVQRGARPTKDEVPWLWCDSSDFMAATGWEPRVTFRSGLEELLQWQARLQQAD